MGLPISAKNIASSSGISTSRAAHAMNSIAAVASTSCAEDERGLGTSVDTIVETPDAPEAPLAGPSSQRP